MDPAVFSAAQPLLDKFADLADNQLVSADLQRLLSDLATVLGPKKIVSLNIIVDVCDEGREAVLPLLTTGLSAFFGKQPFRTWGDSTPQRYVVEDGRMSAATRRRNPPTERSCSMHDPEKKGACQYAVERTHPGPNRPHQESCKVSHSRKCPRRVRKGTPSVYEQGRFSSRFAICRTRNPTTLDVDRALAPLGDHVVEAAP